jgi:hypothetical protein
LVNAEKSDERRRKEYRRSTVEDAVEAFVGITSTAVHDILQGMDNRHFVPKEATPRGELDVAKPPCRAVVLLEVLVLVLEELVPS